jgi:hypothetical protein
MRTLYLIAATAITFNSFAQTTKKSENKTNTDQTHTIIGDKGEEAPDQENIIYTASGLQAQPEFPGGLKALYAFINSKLEKYPSINNAKVYVSFVVEKDGSLSNIIIVRDPGYGLGKEVERVLKLSPKWKPGIQNNKPVRCQYYLPITLNLPATTPIKPNTKE